MSHIYQSPHKCVTSLIAGLEVAKYVRPGPHQEGSTGVRDEIYVPVTKYTYSYVRVLPAELAVAFLPRILVAFLPRIHSSC